MKHKYVCFIALAAVVGSITGALAADLAAGETVFNQKCSNYPLPFFRAQILRNYPQILGRGFCGFRPGCRGLSGMGLRP